MDVVGYSGLMEQSEEATLEELMHLRKSVIDPEISKNSGRVIKLIGDGTLAEFPSVVGALQCAMAIQTTIETQEKGGGMAEPIRLRIGIHVGDVIVEGDDIYGDGVNVAARLEGLADAGGIVLSKQVHDHIGDRVDAEFIALGPQSVKNIARAIEAYKVDLSPHRSAGTIRFGNFEIDEGRFEFRQGGQQVAVEPKVFDLLLYLAKNSQRTVGKDEIFSKIWSDRIVSDSGLSSQIKAARKAVGDNGTAQHTIRTVHGRGFRFVAELEQSNPDPAPASASAPAPVRLIEVPSLAAVSKKPSVAVLPFANMGGDESEAYFCDGVTEDIITALSKNRWLTVIARNSAFAFRNSQDGIKAIGEKLEANYIVTGSVRKAGNRARITIQVVEAETEFSLWVERFDRDLIDMFELQDEISETVTARIDAELGLNEQRKAERRPRKNLGAWDLFQLGLAEFYKFTPQGNERSQQLLREALELDSEFASAHSRLAYAIVLGMVYFDAAPDQDRMDEALTAAKRAIELDDQDANSFFTLGRVYLARREYDLAIDVLEHALELNPCLAVTYCGLGDSLAYEGRLDEAIEHFEAAIRLSPHDPFRWAFYSYRSLAHLFRGEYVDAVTWARKSVQIPNAQYWARAHLVSALGHLGDSGQADRALAQLLQVKPEFTIAFAREHLFYLKRDDQIDLYTDGLRKAGVN